MGKGLALSLKIASREAFRGASPISKVRTPGFLLYLMGNNKPRIIGDLKDDGSGYLRNVKISYRQRGVPGKSSTVDGCDLHVKPAYIDYDVPATSFRRTGLLFEDDLIAQFERDALALKDVGEGGKMTQVMMDVYEALVEYANGLFADINSDLLTLQAANWGKNKVTGNAAAKTINFPLSTATNPMNTGMTEFMSDAMANEMRLAGACIVGNGLINNYYLQQAAKGNDQSGLNTSQLALPKFYYDDYTQAAWGANKFGLFEKDAVQFVNPCRFRGSKGGERGRSYFTTMRIPITDSLGIGYLGEFEFDVQIMYRDCPGEEQIGTYVEGVNEPIQVGRGYNVFLMSSYQAVNIPADSYAAEDPLYQCNGTLNYTATNA